MAAPKKYRVTATMVVVKIAGAQGGETYLRRGRVLPSTVATDEVKRLVERGLVEAFTPSKGGGTGDGGAPPADDAGSDAGDSGSSGS